MSRPIYETAADKQKEHDGLQTYADFIGAKITPTSRLVGWDGEAVINGRRTLIEYKNRKQDLRFFVSYPFMLSKNKVDAMRDEGDVDAVVLLHARDGMMAFDAFDHLEAAIGGRTDRDDPWDTEMCVFYEYDKGVRVE